MTSSRIDHLPPLARSVNCQTRPVKGMRDCKLLLALELRARRTGEPIEGPYAALWRVRGRMDVSNAIKVCEDASQGILVGNDRDCEILTVLRAHDAGPDLEVMIFCWPTERRAYLAAIEAATEPCFSQAANAKLQSKAVADQKSIEREMWQDGIPREQAQEKGPETPSRPGDWPDGCGGP